MVSYPLMRLRGDNPKRRSGHKFAHRRETAPVEVEVESLAWGGKGVAHHDGKAIFVSKVVPGDKLLVRLTRVKTSYAEAEAFSMLKPSPDRVEPKCKFFSHCGGCQWLSTSYPRQLAAKEQLLRSALRHHLDGAELLPIVPAEPSLGYRHRGEFHVYPTGETVKIGFFQEESHRVINLDTCLLFDSSYNLRYQELRAALKEEPAARALESVTMDRSDSAESYVLHFRLHHGGEPEASRLCEIAESLGFQGALATPASDATREIAKVGRPWTTYSLGTAETGADKDFLLRADARSFTQAHYAMNRKLVGSVLEWLALLRDERVLDLYAGGGNFSLPMASRCKQVVAVEGSLIAHRDAKENARESNVLNIVHVPGEVAEQTAMLVAGGEQFDAVVLDPPRTGAKEALGNVASLASNRIIYISCSLPALDRDLAMLKEHGFRVSRIQGWDLFPQTYNLETMVLLIRQTGGQC
jgi:23S rRNA (uracil1939-C5)-methyltransferase